MLSKLLLLTILVLEFSLWAFLALGKRMVLGHDSFELFSDQYYFINSMVSHGQIPFWTPYMTHGGPAWWYFIYSRMDIFSNVLILFSKWIKGMHFLPLFYGSLFFNKFILLAGVWLLARRCFSSPLTVFFVTSTVMASTNAMTQSSFSLVLFYGLPLIIYLLHRFFDTWSWKWLFFAIYFYCTTCINSFYFFPIISLAVFLYFFVFYIKSYRTLIKTFKVDKKDWVWIFLIICLFLVFLSIYFLGHDPLMYINAPDRGVDGHVGLETFLNYGGQTNLWKWWELCLGISPNFDYTVYMGVLSLPLVLLGAFFNKNSNKLPFFLGAVFFLLFSSATSVSILAYYFWPLMKFYRHIGYIAPLIRLYLCFLAGFGFEQLFDMQKLENPKTVFYKSLFSAGFLLMLAIFLDFLVVEPNRILYLLNGLCSRNSSVLINFSPTFYTHALLYMAFLLVGGGLLFFLRAFIKWPEKGFPFLIALIFFHLMDVYGYAYQQIQLRSFPLTESQYALTKFGNIPFADRRMLGDNALDPRVVLAHSTKRRRLDSFNNFTFSDVVYPTGVSDISLKSIQKLFETFDHNKKSPVFLKLAGASEDKIQFFSQAHLASSDQNVTCAMKDKKYAGDLLFYQYPGQHPSLVKTGLQSLDLSQNQRVKIPYRVTSFSPNEITIQADASNHKGVWLEYCDSWYPFWKAQINGHSQGLYIGDLTYKALPLEQGRNTVRFYIENKPLTLFYYFFMYSSFIWMVLLICLLVFYGL